MDTIEHLATIEVLLHGDVTSREVIPQALKINPALFNQVYYDLIHQKKDEATIRRTLELINGYLDEKLEALFGPVLEYLCREGGTRTTSELDSYFNKQVQARSLSNVYEWLADKGMLQKVPAPVRLTPKSQIELDEAAYYYDGGPPMHE
jgi:hypothetical protein